MSVFKGLVFTDKALEDLAAAVRAGQLIEIKRAVVCGFTPPDSDQVYTPYKSSGTLDIAAVKANINKYFTKAEALANTATPYVEAVIKPHTLKEDAKNVLSLDLNFLNTNYDHEIAAKFYGYENWDALIANETEIATECKSLCLLAEDDNGLEYIFAFAKLKDDQQLKFPLALTTELTYRLQVDIFVNIDQSDSIIIQYTPEDLVTYAEFEKHVNYAKATYAKIVDVYTKAESDARFARSAKINNGELVTPDDNGILNLNLDLSDKANVADVYNKSEVDNKTTGTIITHFDVATKTPTKETNAYNSRWLVDNQVATELAAEINTLAGRTTLSNPNFNDVRQTGIYSVINLENTINQEKGYPSTNWGTLIVLYARQKSDNLDRLTQIYFTDVNPAAIHYRTLMANGTFTAWQQMALKADIDNLQNQVNNKATTTDVYDKTTADSRFARSATVNGGAKIMPNTEGNLTLEVPDPDLSNYYTKDETYSKTEVYNKDETYPKPKLYTKDETYSKTEVYNKDETYPKPKLYTQEEIDEMLRSKVIRTAEDVAKYKTDSISTIGKGTYLFFNESMYPTWIKNYLTTFKNRLVVEVLVPANDRKAEEAFVRLWAYLNNMQCVTYTGWGMENSYMSWYDYQGKGVE